MKWNGFDRGLVRAVRQVVLRLIAYLRLVNTESLKETCCVTVRGSFCGHSWTIFLVSIAIGTIGAREHNALPGVSGKSRGGWGDRSHSLDDYSKRNL